MSRQYMIYLSNDVMHDPEIKKVVQRYLEDENGGLKPCLERWNGKIFLVLRVSNSFRVLFQRVKIKDETCLLYYAQTETHDYDKVTKKQAHPDMLDAVPANYCRYIDNSGSAEPALSGKLNESAELNWRGEMVQLTSLQQGVVNDITQLQHQVTIISGPPGSGKTLSIMAGLQRITHELESRDEDGKILFVCETLALLPQLKAEWQAWYRAPKNTEKKIEIVFISYQQHVMSMLSEAESTAVLENPRADCTEFLETHLKKYKIKNVSATHIWHEFCLHADTLFEDFRNNNLFDASKFNRVGARNHLVPDDQLTHVYHSYCEYRKHCGTKQKKNLTLEPVEMPLELYQYVFIDEGHVYSQVQLQMLCRMARSTIVVIDSNQSESAIANIDIFTQWLKNVAKINLIHAELPTTLRTPKKVNALLDKTLHIKNKIVGGVTNRGAHCRVSDAAFDDNNTVDGSVTWISNVSDSQKEHLKNYGQSINFAVIIFDEQDRDYAKERYGVKDLVFTVAQVRGLEFDQVAIVGALHQKSAQKISQQMESLNLKSAPNHNRGDRQTLSHGAADLVSYLNDLFISFSRTKVDLIIDEHDETVPRVRHLFCYLSDIDHSKKTDTNTQAKESALPEAQRESTKAEVIQAAHKHYKEGNHQLALKILTSRLSLSDDKAKLILGIDSGAAAIAKSGAAAAASDGSAAAIQSQSISQPLQLSLSLHNAALLDRAKKQIETKVKLIVNTLKIVNKQTCEKALKILQETIELVRHSQDPQVLMHAIFNCKVTFLKERKNVHESFFMYLQNITLDNAFVTHHFSDKNNQYLQLLSLKFYPEDQDKYNILFFMLKKYQESPNDSDRAPIYNFLFLKKEYAMQPIIAEKVFYDLCTEHGDIQFLFDNLSVSPPSNSIDHLNLNQKSLFNTFSLYKKFILDGHWSLILRLFQNPALREKMKPAIDCILKNSNYLIMGLFDVNDQKIIENPDYQAYILNIFQNNIDCTPLLLVDHLFDINPKRPLIFETFSTSSTGLNIINNIFALNTKFIAEIKEKHAEVIKRCIPNWFKLDKRIAVFLIKKIVRFNHSIVSSLIEFFAENLDSLNLSREFSLAFDIIKFQNTISNKLRLQLFLKFFLQGNDFLDALRSDMIKKNIESNSLYFSALAGLFFRELITKKAENTITPIIHRLFAPRENDSTASCRYLFETLVIFHKVICDSSSSDQNNTQNLGLSGSKELTLYFQNIQDKLKIEIENISAKMPEPADATGLSKEDVLMALYENAKNNAYKASQGIVNQMFQLTDIDRKKIIENEIAEAIRNGHVDHLFGCPFNINLGKFPLLDLFLYDRDNGGLGSGAKAIEKLRASCVHAAPAAASS